MGPANSQRYSLIQIMEGSFSKTENHNGQNTGAEMSAWTSHNYQLRENRLHFGGGGGEEEDMFNLIPPKTVRFAQLSQTLH